MATDLIVVSARDRASVFERTGASWTETRLSAPPAGSAAEFDDVRVTQP
jgi:hypothetical protein